MDGYVCRKWRRLPMKKGFPEIAEQMRGVAAVEKEHEERYRKLAQNIKEGKVFARDTEVLWQCSNCGHQVVAKEAPSGMARYVHIRRHTSRLKRRIIKKIQ